jgi:DnaJ-class molecular chaperone
MSDANRHSLKARVMCPCCCGRGTVDVQVTPTATVPGHCLACKGRGTVSRGKARRLLRMAVR